MPDLDVQIALAAGAFSAGGWLRGSIRVQATRSAPHLEVSVVWVTSGCGTDDEGVVHFEELGGEVADGRSTTLSVRLPLSPTSYSGELVTIGWFVRVRASDGTVWDEPFRVV